VAALDGSSDRDGLRLRVVHAAGDVSMVRAPYVIDASGRTATVARWRGARRRLHDRLVGVVGLLATADPRGDPDSRTIVEAVEHGWWYSAPIPDGRLVVAFMSDGDIVRQLGAHRLTGWSSLLGATDHTLSRVVRLAGRPLAPLRVVLANGSRLDAVAGQGWLAVGDAALAHDPLSSQGLASALLLGLAAADAIRARLGGDRSALDGYGALVDRLDAEYQEGLAHYYRQEMRWPDTPFWVRRHLSAPLAGPPQRPGAADRARQRP
jgi:flavin-dependent dehydrogenase